jgi:hypothetical protein
MVLSYPGGWTAGQTAENVFPQGPLDHLDTLADWFEDRRPPITSGQRQLLEDVLTEAQSVLDADESLSAALRQYIGRLLREVRTALDDERLGERYDFAQAAQRLWVTFLAASSVSTDDAQKTRWADAAKYG